jgi:hypothetical protein
LKYTTNFSYKNHSIGIKKALALIEQYLADNYSDEDLIEGWASPLVEAAIALQQLQPQPVRVPITGEVIGNE